MFAGSVFVFLWVIALRWDWYIEDAAICFSFARNLVNGDGLVASPGGERVEAYSDPLWVAILALVHALGVDGFVSAKPLGVAFGIGTMIAAWRLARDLLPERIRDGAWIAPAALALSPQFGLWAGSGMESPLFWFLLTLALVRTNREIATGGFPWAAVCYVLLTWTRPDGALYAALGFAAFARETIRRGRGPRGIAVWLGVFVVPSAIAEAARIWYFAWPLPNPFYAKITSRGVDLLDWNNRGWRQMRNWTDRLWQAWWLPVYVIGLGRLSVPSTRMALAAVGLVAVLFLWPGFAPFTLLPMWPALPAPPEAFVEFRIVVVFALAAVLPFVALGSGDRDTERALLGASAVGGLFFTLIADGDWMGGFRFMGLVAPLLAVLFALGVSEIVDRWLTTRGGERDTLVAWGVGATVVALSWPAYAQVRDHLTLNVDTTPYSVQRRVEYIQRVAETIHLDEPVVTLDIDQGAFLWFAPDYEQLDLGMLVEIPMARHWFQQRPFVRERIFQEKRPAFVNFGGWWIGYAGLDQYEEWQRYVILPGFLTRFGTNFSSIYLRRDTMFSPVRLTDPDERVVFDWDVEFDQVEVPAVWTPGRSGYIEAPWTVTTRREEKQDVRVIAFLSRDGQIAQSWHLPLGYGFVPMHRWNPGESFRGKYDLPLAASVAPGTYDLGFYVTGPRGYTVPPEVVPPGVITDPPVYARGEVRFPGRVQVVDEAAFAAKLTEIRAGLASAVAATDCTSAEGHRQELRHHTPTDPRWKRATDGEIAPTIARCWAEAARGASGDEQVDALARAHRWNFRDPTLASVGTPVAEALLAEADAARAARDWETAYRKYTQVLSFQPWRAWARRYAEEARDERLGIADDVRIGIGGASNLRAAEEAGTVPPENL